ncbi:MAG TPA: hypothetical protein VM368_09210, partial [Flavisolibacter sp.]|nr:hypothetical protein [Flavisolibacter sp.]
TFTLTQLKDVITEDMHVWKNGMNIWIKASELEEINSFLSQVPLAYSEKTQSPPIYKTPQPPKFTISPDK